MFHCHYVARRLLLCSGESMAGWAVPGCAIRRIFRRTRGVTMSAESHKTMADVRENIATVKREAGGSGIDDQTATTF